jgi:hypothetical protein
MTGSHLPFATSPLQYCKDKDDKETLKMPKEYLPHCPSSNCSGGLSHRLRRSDADFVEIPLRILATKDGTEVIHRCSACGLVWFQKESAGPGFNPRPVGFYKKNNPLTRHEFEPVPANLPIREQNTSAYWKAQKEQLLRRGKRRSP